MCLPGQGWGIFCRVVTKGKQSKAPCRAPHAAPRAPNTHSLSSAAVQAPSRLRIKRSRQGRNHGQSHRSGHSTPSALVMPVTSLKGMRVRGGGGGRPAHLHRVLSRTCTPERDCGWVLTRVTGLAPSVGESPAHSSLVKALTKSLVRLTCIYPVSQPDLTLELASCQCMIPINILWDMFTVTCREGSLRPHHSKLFCLINNP